MLHIEHVLFTLFHSRPNPIVISWNSLEPWRVVHSHSEIVQILHNNHSRHLKNEHEWRWNFELICYNAEYVFAIVVYCVFAFEIGLNSININIDQILFMGGLPSL